MIDKLNVAQEALDALAEERRLRRGPLSTLESRLVVAWRDSGIPLGKLLVLAADAYALGSSDSMTGLVDEAMVSMAERWIRERVGQ